MARENIESLMNASLECIEDKKSITRSICSMLFVRDRDI